jgi:hypothetical protein
LLLAFLQKSFLLVGREVDGDDAFGGESRCRSPVRAFLGVLMGVVCGFHPINR